MDVITAAGLLLKTCVSNLNNFSTLPISISARIRRKHNVGWIWQKILNKLTKEVQIALQDYRVSLYNSCFKTCIRESGDSNLWRVIKILLNQEINSISPLRTNTKLVISDGGKCNVFSDILQNTKLIKITIIYELNALWNYRTI